MAIALDFFSGVGGLSFGLQQAGFDIALGVEIEDIAGRYAQYNSPHTKVWYGAEQGDIRKFSASAAELLQIRDDKKSSIRRLVPTELSTTIRAGTTSDRGSWSAPRPLHPYLNRVISTRECARIQSFPDFWTFHPSTWHGNRMVGNAVPPLLAKAVGRKIIEDLNLEISNNSNLFVKKDTTLIEQDIENAASAGYGHRKVSHYVASWKRRI